ncbi:MAG: CRISPR-associated helicase Cas3' [Psychrosphaera sp.]|nr:CRISPR-associated helicase Cas3' [Psychrosphaera sp.]
MNQSATPLTGESTSQPQAAYFRYWGKAKKPLEIDYSEGQLTAQQIVDKYESVNSVEHLQALVIKNGWQQSRAFARYHQLAYHSLDVAAVGKLILEQNLFSTDGAIARLTDDKTAFIDFFTHMLALHDIGKFATAFQSLRKFACDELVPVDASYSYSIRHDSLGYVLWLHELKDEFLENYPRKQKRVAARNLKAFMALVTGHHGKPPTSTDGSVQVVPSRYFSEHDITAAQQFLHDSQFLQPGPLPDFLLNDDNQVLITTLSWLFAGVTILADWMGSDQAVFKYQSTPTALSEYWQNCALPRAQQILKKDGYGEKTALVNFTDVKTLIDHIDQPTPLQKYCATCTLDVGAQLFLLEDVTGSGKTEAALILAQRLLSEHGPLNERAGAGLYIALPTMATSNAMFERMEAVYRGFFTKDKTPSLVLAHGARHLSERFSDMVKLASQPIDQNYDKDEQSASGWCNYWFVDNRKKSLLADVGVGTVDQALLGILPARHQALRLLGIAQKVLIIDEIHSYSTYESKLIQALIKFHTSLGGTTILLSATMPYVLRQDLIKAYTDGLQVQAPIIKTDAQFPWFTSLGANIGINEQPIASRPAVSRTVHINYQTEEADIWQLITTSLAQGKSVCWIRNTVNETIECYDAAVEKFPDLVDNITLFHSRFCMNDRIVTETKVLKQFGKHSTSAQRQGQLLISSPILDQSLDVDMTVMISDVAPIDVLIQRLGRCCRHLRYSDENCIKNPDDTTKDGRGQPILHLFGPEFDAEPQKTWLSDFSYGTQAIYPDTARIWLTVKILQQEKQIEMPGSARFLIESIYGPDVIEKVPSVLQDINDKVTGDKASESFLAKFNQLDVTQGYSLDSNNQGWCDESQIPTRLADETVDFVLLLASDNVLGFYAAAEKYPLDMSKISIRKTTMAQCAPALLTQYQSQLEDLQAAHPALQYCEALILTASAAGGFTSEAVDDRQSASTVSYDGFKGLQVCRDN